MSAEVLNYVKLHISRIPKAIKAKKPQFNTLKTIDNSLLYTVYKKVPIDDIQILINNKANTEQFPIIGYKHHTKGGIAWNKDR